MKTLLNIPYRALLILAILLVLGVPTTGSAGAGGGGGGGGSGRAGGVGTGGGGGNWTESDLKHMLARLEEYIYSAEGQQLYPETVAFDKANRGLPFNKIMQALNPRLISKRVFDQYGNERDCFSWQSKELGRYFMCDIASLPPKPDATGAKEEEYFGTMYRLVLHEAFVQAGLEAPVAKEIPSVYPLASRLMVHLENFPEWVPGAKPEIPARPEKRAQSAEGIENLRALTQPLKACALREVKEFSKTLLKRDLDFEVSISDQSRSNVIGVSVVSKGSDSASDCWIGWRDQFPDLAISAYGCGLNPTLDTPVFTHDLPGEGHYSCELPHYEYKTQMNNQGKLVINRVWLEKGTCPIVEKLNLEGSFWDYRASSEGTFNVKRFYECLESGIKGKGIGRQHNDSQPSVVGGG